ncbi:MAG: hypothetical protein K2F94_00580 [Muribaculaceae bacterium]|nr:hypothetical protein [Muribaculaceae bacterium]
MKRKEIICAAYMAVALCPASGYGAAAAGNLIENGKVWRDVAGDTINEHGGGVLFAEGKYYRYGEQSPSVRGHGQDGITVYSSADLSQGNSILKVAGRDDACIAMFDRWNPSCLKDSRYLWLPVSLGPEGITVEWKDGWTPSEQW